MASSHKKRTGLRAALIVLLCLVLVCVVAAAVLYSFVSRKIKAFQSGASFALDYTITSTEAEPPALYALLDKFGGTTGSLTGQYTPRAVQLALYPTARQARDRCRAALAAGKPGICVRTPLPCGRIADKGYPACSVHKEE